MKHRCPSPESKLPSEYEKANRALCIELYNLHRSKGVKGERWIKEGAENRYGSDKSIEQLNSGIKDLGECNE